MTEVGWGLVIYKYSLAGMTRGWGSSWAREDVMRLITGRTNLALGYMVGNQIRLEVKMGDVVGKSEIASIIPLRGS